MGGFEDEGAVLRFNDEFYRQWLRIDAAYDSFARQNGMTPAEHDVFLGIVSLGEGATQKAIAEYAGLPKQTVSSVVAKARERGLAVTRTSESDGRSAVVALTDAGHERFDAVDARRRRVEVSVMREIGEEDAAVALRVLRAYASGLRRGFGLEGGDAR